MERPWTKIFCPRHAWNASETTSSWSEIDIVWLVNANECDTASQTLSLTPLSFTAKTYKKLWLITKVEVWVCKLQHRMGWTLLMKSALWLRRKLGIVTFPCEVNWNEQGMHSISYYQKERASNGRGEKLGDFFTEVWMEILISSPTLAEYMSNVTVQDRIVG